MANVCLTQRGDLTQWPRPGGWYEQDDEEMALMRLAWYVSKLYQRDANGKMRPWTADDAEFLFWLEEPDDDLFDYEIVVKADTAVV